MKLHSMVFALIGSVFCTNAVAEEYFGEFKNELVGTWINQAPRPVFELNQQFNFVDPNEAIWSVPEKARVNGASIPKPFWSFVGSPFTGNYLRASVVHDYYCDIKNRTAHDTHRNFYYGMRSAGVSKWKAKFMYWAVATFGPKWKIEKRIKTTLNCIETDNGLNCQSVPTVVEENVLVESVDLDNPDILSVALSKAATVARTLKTTDGETLDISMSGEIGASIASIEQNSEEYRSVFFEGDYLKDTSVLGLLSSWDFTDSDSVTVWDSNKLPVYGEVRIAEESPKLFHDYRNILDPTLDDFIEYRADHLVIPSEIRLEERI